MKNILKVILLAALTLIITSPAYGVPQSGGGEVEKEEEPYINQCIDVGENTHGSSSRQLRACRGCCNQIRRECPYEGFSIAECRAERTRCMSNCNREFGRKVRSTNSPQ